MKPKRYSIYPSPALDRVLSARLSSDEGRSRSALISAIADRYAEVVARSMPLLSLPEWGLIFEAINGYWSRDHAYLSAHGIALEVADASNLNGADVQWGIDGNALVERIDGMPFASKIAILDASERFCATNTQPDGEIPDNADPFAHWRGPIRAIVGRLADDRGGKPDVDL